MALTSLITNALVAAGVLAGGQAIAQEKPTVGWGTGYYQSEDDALCAAIKKFEPKHPTIRVDQSLYAPQEAIPKTVAALDSGSPPDVAYGDVDDFRVTAKWAYQGRLDDVPSIIDPMRAEFEAAALATTFLHNDQTKSRAYDAFPIKQQTLHIQYCTDMLAEAGFTERP